MNFDINKDKIKNGSEQITVPEELKLIGEVLNDIYEDVSQEGE